LLFASRTWDPHRSAIITQASWHLTCEKKTSSDCCFVVEDLSYLTITSKALRNFVQLYHNTELARRIIFKPPLLHSEVSAAERSVHYEQFRKYGKQRLYAVVTC